MHQISWMLSLLPEWFWTLVFIAGLIALATSWFRTPYKVPLKVGGIVGIILGTWFMGMYANEAKWQARVKELEEKLAAAEQESKKENVVIQEKIIYKDKIIREKAKTQIEYIDRVITQDKEVIKYVEMCPVPKAVIEEHNKAAMPPEAIKEINKAAEGAKK